MARRPRSRRPGRRLPGEPRPDQQAGVGPAGRRRQHDRVAGSTPGGPRLTERLEPGEDLPRRPDRPGPADRDDERPPPGPLADPRRPARRAPPAPHDRPSRRRGRSRRAARRAAGSAPGGSSGGPLRTRWTSRPAFAPAAAVSRQWFDQRRPDVISVSAPSASAAPTRNSRFRSLLPPNASGSRSSRLIQTSTPPPSAAENRARAAGAATARRAAGTAAARRSPEAHRAEHRRIVARCYAAGTPMTPTSPPPARAVAPGSRRPARCAQSRRPSGWSRPVRGPPARPLPRRRPGRRPDKLRSAQRARRAGRSPGSGRRRRGGPGPRGRARARRRGRRDDRPGHGRQPQPRDAARAAPTGSTAIADGADGLARGGGAERAAADRRGRPLGSRRRRAVRRGSGRRPAPGAQPRRPRSLARQGRATRTSGPPARGSTRPARCRRPWTGRGAQPATSSSRNAIGQLDDGADFLKLYLDGPDPAASPWTVAEIAPGRRGGPRPRRAR